MLDLSLAQARVTVTERDGSEPVDWGLTLIHQLSICCPLTADIYTPSWQRAQTSDPHHICLPSLNCRAERRALRRARERASKSPAQTCAAEKQSATLRRRATFLKRRRRERQLCLRSILCQGKFNFS